MKINPSTYAEELRKKLGLDHASKIADARMRGTHPQMWSSIPTGVVFFNNDHKAKSIGEKELTKIHAFWVEVFHILKKKYNVK